MKLTKLAVVLSAVSTPALCSTNSGTVQNVIVGGNIAYISIVGGAYASCATNNRYVISLTNETGKAMYAMAMASKVSGAPMEIIGSGACSIMGGTDAEDVLNTFLL